MESGKQALKEFKEWFTEIGGCSQTLVFNLVTTPGDTPYSDNVVTPTDVTRYCIQDDEMAIEYFGAHGITPWSHYIIIMWGGALDSLGRDSVIVPKLESMKQGDGGATLGTTPLRLATYVRGQGMIIGGITMVWYLAFEGGASA
jgi:hypothetical protein